MIIEVGKAYRTRDGKRALVSGADARKRGFIGGVEGRMRMWGADGLYSMDPSAHHVLDLISPWEDSKTEDAAPVSDDALEQFGWWPGGYTLRCPSCDERSYENGKRVSRCRQCAEKLYTASLASSKTEIKSESKMDVKVKDRVLVEFLVLQLGSSGTGFYGCPVSANDGRDVYVPLADVKSVEPAPPAVGDVCSWNGDAPDASRDHWKVIAVEGDHVWVKNEFAEQAIDRISRSGFRIVKRVEPK